MQTIYINSALCVDCERYSECPVASACLMGAIVPINNGDDPDAKGYEVIEEMCQGCLLCARMCPKGAVRIKVG